jgi:hypothetical protein
MSWKASTCASTPSADTALVSFLTVLLLDCALAGDAATAPVSAIAAAAASARIRNVMIPPLPGLPHPSR